MSTFREISAREEWTKSPYDRFHKDWALLGAQKSDGSVNMMTISWGGVGIMWHKPVVSVVVRSHRYTKEFIDNTDNFSLSFFDEEYRDKLLICGKKSGRDIDKMKACEFTAQSIDGAPVFEQANSVLVCRKLFAQTMPPENFIDKNLLDEFYSGDYAGKYHDIYFAEVLKALVK